VCQTPADGRRIGDIGIAPAHHAEAIDTGIETLGAIPYRRRVLVVDDNIEMRILVARMCACLGCSTHYAADGRQALVDLQDGSFDLVITDYEMPVMDGFELAALIRHRHPCLPVLLMTGRYDQDLRERLQTTDLFVGLLEKPFNLMALQEKRRILEMPAIGSRAV
jgi:two-component system capsular synthesis sensor histidine kinase RcsC